MTPIRWRLVVIAVLGLAALWFLLFDRNRKIAACRAAGRTWIDPPGRCGPPSQSPILEREGLRRT